MNILLPIHLYHAENILNCRKTFEYRKVYPKQKIDKIIIYVTAPVKLVLGEVTVIDILADTPEVIWNKTKKSSGISEDFFYTYFRNKNKAIAYRLWKATRYTEPKTLLEIDISYPPQSMVYLP